MISVVVATCHRPEMFTNMMVSLIRTTKDYELEVIAVVDEDAATKNIAITFNTILDFSPQKRGALACWNLGLSMSRGDIIVPAGDDQLFHPDWLKYALESHQEKLNGYGVVGMNDMAYDGNLQLATIILFDRQYCKDYMGGVIAPPVYKYYCVDSEWNAKAKALGKFYWDERSKVEHLHSAHGKRPLDQHDIEKGGLIGADNITFEERKALGFPINWESVI
jgi:glycosyltransferase involved in cell wall biosynthesis